MRKANRKEKNKHIIKMLLSGSNYSSTGKRYGTSPQSVKTILFRELEKILTEEDWGGWLLPNQRRFTDLKINQLQERKQFILEKMQQE